MSEEIVGKAILDAAFHVHTVLGPGLLESVYEAALARELQKRGHKVERQKGIPVHYDNEILEIGFRADLIVEAITNVFKKTVNTYLRLIPLKLGFLINFNEAHLKDGILRVVNGLEGKPFFNIDLRTGREVQLSREGGEGREV